MTVRFGYAINQYKPNFDFFTRREQHVAAMRTISISGFSGIELKAGSGRWEPLGNPYQIGRNFGSPAGLKAFLAGAKVDAVASFFLDPTAPTQEEPAGPLSILETSDHAEVAARCAVFAAFLAEVGGSALVVRAFPSAWRQEATPEALERAAACWNAVGRETSARGITLALHVDFLSGLRTEADILALLERTDAASVGLAVDTAEQWIAGIDPAQLVSRAGDRVRHLHLKDARERVGDEVTIPSAERVVRQVGGSRRIERWFYELGEGEVDLAAVLRALPEGFEGWAITECEETPGPDASTMLSGWVVQRVLAPLVA